MHDMQNMQMLFPICRICTAHFADEPQVPVSELSEACAARHFHVAAKDAD